MKPNKEKGIPKEVSHGIWIPLWSFQVEPLRSLSAGERQLYCLIFGLSRSVGYCFASNSKLSAILNSSPNAIGNSVSKLKNNGLVSVNQVGKSRQISPLIDITKADDGPLLVEGQGNGTSTKSGGPQADPPLKVEGTSTKSGGPYYNKLKTKQKLSRPSGGDGVEMETDMPFLESLETEKTPPSKFDIDCASKLKDALNTKNLITRPVSLRNWSNEFRILRKTNKKAIIKSVLKWYCDHAGQKYISVALSAGSFRRKFDNIKHQSENHVTPTSVKKHTEYDQATTSLYNELRHLHWPKGTKTQLMDAIQDSVLEYGVFWKALTDVTKRTDVDPKVLRFAKELRSSIPSLKTFVRDWFEGIHKSVANWKDWSGNLRSMALRRDHKKFHSLGQGWSDDYCGDPSRWDKLLELLG